MYSKTVEGPYFLYDRSDIFAVCELDFPYDYEQECLKWMLVHVSVIFETQNDKSSHTQHFRYTRVRLWFMIERGDKSFGC